MKKVSLFIIISLLTLFNKTSFCQTSTSVDSLICQEWKLVFYEDKGEKFPPTPEQKDSRMIFYLDHKVKSIEPDNIQNGVWKYNLTNKQLSITDNETAEIANMKVLKLTKKEIVLEYKDPDGIPLKMYMEPVPRK